MQSRSYNNTVHGLTQAAYSRIEATHTALLDTVQEANLQAVKTAIHGGLLAYRASTKGAFGFTMLASSLKFDASTQKQALDSFLQMRTKIDTLASITEAEFVAQMGKSADIFSQHADVNRLAADIILQLFMQRPALDKVSVLNLIENKDFMPGGRSSSLQTEVRNRLLPVKTEKPLTKVDVLNALQEDVISYLQQALLHKMANAYATSASIKALSAAIKASTLAQQKVKQSEHALDTAQDQAQDKLIPGDIETATPAQIAKAERLAHIEAEDALDHSASSSGFTGRKNRILREMLERTEKGDPAAMAKIPALQTALAAAKAELELTKESVRTRTAALSPLELAVYHCDYQQVMINMDASELTTVTAAINTAMAESVDDLQAHLEQQTKTIKDRLTAAAREAASNPMLAKMASAPAAANTSALPSAPPADFIPVRGGAGGTTAAESIASLKAADAAAPATAAGSLDPVDAMTSTTPRASAPPIGAAPNIAGRVVHAPRTAPVFSHAGEEDPSPVHDPATVRSEDPTHAAGSAATMASVFAPLPAFPEVPTHPPVAANLAASRDEPGRSAAMPA